MNRIFSATRGAAHPVEPIHSRKQRFPRRVRHIVDDDTVSELRFDPRRDATDRFLEHANTLGRNVRCPFFFFFLFFLSTNRVKNQERCWSLRSRSARRSHRAWVSSTYALEGSKSSLPRRIVHARSNFQCRQKGRRYFFTQDRWNRNEVRRARGSTRQYSRVRRSTREKIHARRGSTREEDLRARGFARERIHARKDRLRAGEDPRA